MKAAAVFVLAVTAAAAAATLLFNPAVSTAEIQRRDMLPPSAQFVDATYRYFLGRPADSAGLTEYQALYDNAGPQAVVLAIVSSPEYRQKHAEIGATPRTDPANAASSFVQLYESGALQPPAPINDWPGRAGFVLIILITTCAIAFLQRWSARPLSGNALYVYLPRWYSVAVFASMATLWWLNDQASFYTFAPGSLGYAEWLDRLTNLSISRGVTNVWTPYPQGTQLVLVVIESVATSVARWFQSDIWTNYTLFRWMFQAVFLLLPSIVTVSIAYDLGTLMSPASATFAAMIVAFSFAPIYYGLASTLVTDPLPAALALLAIWFSVRQRSILAGVALGLGAALKLIPIVIVVPLLVLSSNWRPRLRLALAAGVVLAAVFVPFALANPDMFMSPFRWQTGRPAWESWYAFVGWLIGAPHEFSSAAFEDLGLGHAYGWVFWGITPPLTSLITPVPASAPRLDNAVSVVGTLISLIGVASAKSSSPRARFRWSMYVLAVTLFWSIGWSPQYELYLVPLVALAFETPLVALGAVFMLEVLTFLEYPLFLPWAYFYGGSAVWLTWGSTLARYLVLGWLALYVLRTEGSIHAFIGRLRALRPPSVTRRVAVVGAVLASLMVPGIAEAQTLQTCGATHVAPSAPVQMSPDTDWMLPGGWFFTQASNRPDQGYTIADDGAAQMFSEFSRLGGWRVLGFPSSRRFVWHGLLSQATQRAVLQWSQTTGQVEFANVLDLLHDDGYDDVLRRQDEIPPPMDIDDAGLPYEAIAANRLGWLDARPAIKSTYCNAPGGADPVQLWGLPTSQAVNMSDTGEVFVVRTQRAAFQEWVVGAPWAAPGEVTVVLAGDLAKQFDLLPAEAGVPEAAPPHDALRCCSSSRSAADAAALVQ